jgi:cytoskeletal protein RodZ
MRESAGLDVEDISAETKVSRRILEALEQGRFQFLPEKVFSRSFVAQYARTIGIDEGPMVEAFDSAWEHYTLMSGTHPNLFVETQDVGPTIRWRFWIPIAIGGLILAIATAAILRGTTSVADGLRPDPRRSGASQIAAVQPTHPPTPSAPTQVAIRRTPEMVEEAMVQMIVAVDQGEECWIHYRDREGMTGQRMLTSGVALTLELAGPVKLTVGNAGAVELTIEGTTYRDLGLPGQVIHTEVNRSGFTPLGSSGFDG